MFGFLRRVTKTEHEHFQTDQRVHVLLLKAAHECGLRPVLEQEVLETMGIGVLLQSKDLVGGQTVELGLTLPSPWNNDRNASMDVTISGRRGTLFHVSIDFRALASRPSWTMYVEKAPRYRGGVPPSIDTLLDREHRILSEDTALRHAVELASFFTTLT